MKLRYVILLVAVGMSIWIWSGNPRLGVAGEAAESSQGTEVWLGGKRVSPPVRRSTPPPKPLVEDNQAAKETVARKQGEKVEVIVPEVPQSSDAAGEPAAAQVGDTTPESDTDSPIATALDECLRQSHASLMDPPRPLRELVSQRERSRTFADEPVQPPAPAVGRRAGTSVAGADLEVRGGNTHEQVSYVTPRLPPSASSVRGAEVPDDRSAPEMTAAESAFAKAASISTSPSRDSPRQDTASTSPMEMPPNSPQLQARADAAGSTAAPDAADASQPAQFGLTEFLTMLGIVTLVLVAMRRWGAGKDQSEPSAAT